MLQCSRAGVRRFVVEAGSQDRDVIRMALGSFGASPNVTVVDSIDGPGGWREGIDPAAPCITLRGNLVMAQSQLRRALADYARNPGHDLRVTSVDNDRGGSIEVGPIGASINGNGHAAGGTASQSSYAPTGYLPFALNGRPEDREEAELRLAKTGGGGR